jgi:hypothetical protein
MRGFRRPWLGLVALGATSLVLIPQPTATGQAPAPADCTMTYCAYLPLTTRPVTATILFGTNGYPPNPPLTEFPAGARQFYYDVTIHGAIGQSYRLQLDLPRDELPDDTGTISTTPTVLRGVFCYSFGNNGCQNPTSPLEPGTYTLRVFVQDELIAERSAIVPPQATTQAPPRHIQP